MDADRITKGIFRINQREIDSEESSSVKCVQGDFKKVKYLIGSRGRPREKAGSGS